MFDRARWTWRFHYCSKIFLNDTWIIFESFKSLVMHNVLIKLFSYSYRVDKEQFTVTDLHVLIKRFDTIRFLASPTCLEQNAVNFGFSFTVLCSFFPSCLGTLISLLHLKIMKNQT